MSESHRLPPHNELEITHSEFVGNTATATKRKQRLPFFLPALPSTTRRSTMNTPKAKMTKHLGNLFSTNKQQTKIAESTDSSSMAVYCGGDNSTLFSGGQSVVGGSSVAGSAAATLHSQQTQKASNKQDIVDPGGIGGYDSISKSPSNWKRFKKFVAVKSNMRTANKLTPIKADSIPSSGETKRRLDKAIIGRLDGIDCMNLGPANASSKQPKGKAESTIKFSRKSFSKDSFSEDSSDKDGIPPSIDFDPLHLSFTGLSTLHSSSAIVSDMVWTSGGKNQPELVLEGFNADRWTLQLHGAPPSPSSISTYNSNYVPKLEPIDDDEESSTVTDNATDSTRIGKFWGQLWGDDNVPLAPVPSEEEVDDDDLLEIAASCSVPIDLDEGTFIIESPQHLQSVHELVTIPLQAQRFENALMIFNKLLKGLEQAENSNLEHLIGSTYHNMGIIYTCMGKFQEALHAFQKAVDARIAFYAQSHPLVAVSLVRRGEAYFALGFFNDASDSFEKALEMMVEEDVTRAKILNNSGVAHYHLKDYDKALESFSSAIEIQRRFLDGPVRRQPIIYDASVTLSNMGRVYHRKKEYKRSCSLYEEAFMTTAFPKDHDIVLSNLKSMALVMAKNDQSTEALRIFRNLLRYQEESFGKDSEQYIETLGMIGCLLAKDLDFEESLECLKIVLTWQKKHLPKSNAKIAVTKKTIKKVKKLDEAKISVWI